MRNSVVDEPTLTLPDLYKQIERLLDGARDQGRREATNEILQAVGSRQVLSSKDHSNLTARSKRAARGTSEALVRRVLTAGPETAKGIAAKAKTEDEKILTLPAIYLELKRGKKQKRYKNQNGKWVLL